MGETAFAHQDVQLLVTCPEAANVGTRMGVTVLDCEGICQHTRGARQRESCPK